MVADKIEIYCAACSCTVGERRDPLENENCDLRRGMVLAVEVCLCMSNGPGNAKGIQAG